MFELKLLCPVCKFDCTHVQRAYSLAGNPKGQPESQPGPDGKLYGVACQGYVGERRGCLVIEVDGECGHSFRLNLQQHKGVTFVYCDGIGSVDPYDPTIWSTTFLPVFAE